jgi:hypothetical protein
VGGEHVSFVLPQSRSGKTMQTTRIAGETPRRPAMIRLPCNPVIVCGGQPSENPQSAATTSHYTRSGDILLHCNNLYRAASAHNGNIPPWDAD